MSVQISTKNVLPLNRHNGQKDSAKTGEPRQDFDSNKRISPVACVGCRLEKASHIHVKFGKPLADSSLEVHTKFGRDPSFRFALVNDALS